MSHTKRAYNRHGFISRIAYSGLEYHPHRQQERHKCSYCYDFQRSKHLRMARKAEVRQVSDEFAAFGLFTGDAPYDMTDQDTTRDLLKSELPVELVDLWYVYQFPYDDFGVYGDW